MLLQTKMRRSTETMYRKSATYDWAVLLPLALPPDLPPVILRDLIMKVGSECWVVSVVLWIVEA